DTSPAAIHLGTIAINQAAQPQPISLVDNGNISITPSLALSQPASPFSLSASMVALFPGPGNSATVTCGSNAATGGPVTKTVDVDLAAGSGIFGTTHYSHAVDCTIVDTPVQIQEGSVDFGTVLWTDPPASQQLHIINT